MKSMGTPPPRNKENAMALREVWAMQSAARQEKPPMPEATYNDQFGGRHEPDEKGLFDCPHCGEPWRPGTPFLYDYKNEQRWCEPCLREFAAEHGIH